MKKSELRQIIREEIQKLHELSGKESVLKEGMREDLAAQRNMMRDFETSRTRRRYSVTEGPTPNKAKFLSAHDNPKNYHSRKAQFNKMYKMLDDKGLDSDDMGVAWDEADNATREKMFSFVVG